MGKMEWDKLKVSQWVETVQTVTALENLNQVDIFIIWNENCVIYEGIFNLTDNDNIRRRPGSESRKTDGGQSHVQGNFNNLPSVFLDSEPGLLLMLSLSVKLKIPS